MLTANLPPLPASPAAPRQSHDWADIDNSDHVAKVRGSAGFRIMREIQPWDGALDAPPALLANKVFEFFYVQRKEADMWKTLAKECFGEDVICIQGAHVTFAKDMTGMAYKEATLVIVT